MKKILSYIAIGLVLIVAIILGNKIIKPKVELIYNKHMLKNLDVVLYNSHVQEKYDFGSGIKSITKELENKIQESGLNSYYLDTSDNLERKTAFDFSKELIKREIPRYGGKILLDVHIDEKDVSNINEYDDITLIIGKSNKSYKENLKFAQLVLGELRKNKDISSSIKVMEGINHNQNLSPYALTVELGNKNISEASVKNYLDAWVSALINVRK